ncbi:Putative Ig domain-containing protein [Bryocella elongata]|uniref:Putative Ig domain-containing protein n=1 Tax=Bryocella elongata TaxID=863522 RepID=A0A1H5UTK7_9BACT|nr:putative Ig domain-containing protein [Bryocella elongata]SEF77781.1 Putative Ig domain-containing protein [Bryocella elongata]
MRRGSIRQAVWSVLTSFIVALSIALSGCSGGGAVATVSVSATASATTVDGGDAITISATVTNDKNSAGVTWTTSAGTLSGTTTSSATLTAPAATSSAQTVTVTATSMTDTTKSATVTLTVPAAPSITTSTLASGTVGSAYSAALAGSGGLSPYTWALTSGTLPSGLSFTASTGTITGTPTATGAGTASLSFKMTDSGTATALTATKTLSLTIAPAAAITFTTTTLANATYNTAYSATIATAGGAGTLTYSLASGSLPTGLSLSTGGALTGTPTAGGSFSFSVKAADAYGDSATQSFTVTVVYPALTLNPSTTALAATVGKSYSQSFTASGGAGTGFTFSITSGASALTAAGLSFSGSTLSGTPTSAATIPFTMQVLDSASNTASVGYTLTISYAALTISPATLPSAVVNSAYSQTLTASGGSGTGYTWSVTTGATSLTAVGLSLSGGVISGTPTSSGSASFTAQVKDSASNTASQSYTLTVNASLSVTSATLPSAVVGSAYSTTLTATGGSGSYTWAIASGSSAPAGLSLSTAGVLSGTPTVASGGAATTFQVQATDTTSHTATGTLSITINPSLGIATSTTLASGYVGTAYSQTLAASGGTGAGYSWSVASGSSLPSWATLTSGGALSGTPTTAGTYTFTLTVTDSGSDTNAAQFTLTVNGTLAISTTSLSAATVGTAYSQSIGASGGTGSDVFSISSGSLPSWATLNTSTGKITGTPGSTNTGSTTFTVMVEDSASHTATQNYTLTVYAILGTNDSYLSGHYAFYATGWVDGTNDGNTYKSALAGSFVADGAGNITSGTLDYNDASGGLAESVSLTGTYALPSTNLGQMTLSLSTGKTVVIAFNAGNINSGVATAGDLIRFDDTSGIGITGGSRFSGEFAQQTLTDFTTAKLAGGYVFGLTGESCPLGVSACNSATDHGPLATAGVMSLSGAGLVSSGQQDIASGTNVYTLASFSGTYGTPDASNGRATLTLSAGSTLPSSDANIWPHDFVIYMVNATKFYVVSVDSHANYSLLAGKAAQQTTSSFTTSNFSGSAVFWGAAPSDNYIAAWGTSAAVSGSNAIVGRTVATTSGTTLSVVFYQNQQGTVSSQTGSGTYSVASNGRMTFTGVGSNPPIFYLSGTNTAYAVETGQEPGVLYVEPQTATTPGSGTYVFGNLNVVPEGGGSLGAGTIGSGTFGLTTANSDSGGTLQWNQSAAGTYTVDATGLLTFSDGGTGYVISATKLIHMDGPGASGASPSVSVVQQ